MRIGIQTWGSEGDLRPFFALAEGLVQAGHAVELVYSSADDREYSARLARASFSHRKVGSLGLDWAEVQALAARVFSDSNSLRQLEAIFTHLLDPVIDAMAEAAHELAARADVLVYHPLAHPLGAAAERAKKPIVGVYTAPLIPTRELPPPGLPSLGWLNVLTWKVAIAVLDRKLHPGISRVRAAAGLHAVKRSGEQIDRAELDLLAVSPLLVPRAADWPAKVHVSGFLNPAQPAHAYALPAELEAFFAAGPPPLFVTFGSMSVGERSPDTVLRIIEAAVERADARAIVQLGPELPPSPVRTKRLFQLGAAPHDDLFPRCAAIVHHGGAGTTQSALRAGRPSVVVAHISDQLFWGARLASLGVAPKHLTRRSLDAGRLARALAQALGDERMRARAAELGEGMRREDGVRTAVALIEGVRR